MNPAVLLGAGEVVRDAVASVDRSGSSELTANGRGRTAPVWGEACGVGTQVVAGPPWRVDRGYLNGLLVQGAGLPRGQPETLHQFVTSVSGAPSSVQAAMIQPCVELT